MKFTDIRSLRSRRVLWLPVLLAAAVSSVPSTASAAEKAKLSDDILARLRGAKAETTSVIVTADAGAIAEIATRHGLQIKKQLQGGAVLDVPADKLAALATEAGIAGVSGDLRVQSQMAVTDIAIGADQAWAGGIAGATKGLTGAGVGIAVI